MFSGDGKKGLSNIASWELRTVEYVFELKDKGWYSVEKDLVHNAKYFENRGNRDMEAVNVWYFVSHIMKPLSRHVYVITTKFNYFDFYLWKIEKNYRKSYGKFCSLCKETKVLTKEA